MMLKTKDNLSNQEEKNTAGGNIPVFTGLTRESAEKYMAWGSKCPYLPSCYSAGFLLMWSDFFNAAFGEAGGCAVVKLKIKGKEQFLYPYAVSPDADVGAALSAIEKYTAKNSIPLNFYGVPRSELPGLAARYNNMSFTVSRNDSDYIYLASDMKEFAGKKFSGQRNHLNKFNKICREARFRPLGEGDTDRDMLKRFWERYEAGFTSGQPLAKTELEKSKKIFAEPGVGIGIKACVELKNEIISVCWGEVWGDALIIHIEKALDDCPGAYQFMVTSFAQSYAGDCRYINREDDAGTRGLRISKTQYHPTKIEENITVEVRNELSRLSAPPEIRTANLTLDRLDERDIPAYNRLCLDMHHNRFWGYDYREHIDGEPEYDYFYRDAMTDYRNKVSLTLAVRHIGVFIGEAVINEFDMRGSANLGLRILPEYTGRGYGKEAFAALADYAIYGLGLNSVTAYCYKENASSYRMLAATMERDGEDEKYSYFRKMV